jgi:hypothetical protein
LTPLHIKAPWGLGDAIYVRPLLKSAAKQRTLYVDTPWPEFYDDIDNLKFVRGERLLRTQNKNIRRQPPERWTPLPAGLGTIALGYGHLEMEHGVFAAMERKLPMTKPEARAPNWDLPDMGPCPFDTGGAPLAVVRPVMRRLEWDNQARNPLPEYINFVAGDLKRRGFAVVVIADTSNTHNAEWIEGGVPPPHNLARLRGEGTVNQLMAMVRDAAVVVGGVGWIVPAAIAMKTPTFIVLGGNGGMNAPSKIIDRRMDGSRIGFAVPREFCQCIDMRHQCVKLIPDLEKQWRRWASALPRLSRSSRAA